ncbi:DUF6221 family protein [Streptomyces rubiginosohelvolus]|uniref:DUF6221 family protein n=1 Tax=Streptomyces rubiginosohelvolus TaxID=67362 RepID=UPI00378F0E0B
MSDLADFLRARIAERRAIAEAATPGPWEGVVDRHQRGEVDASVWADSISYYVTEKITSGGRHEADAHHIAAHDPAAALADLDAKLAVVDLMERTLWFAEGDSEVDHYGALGNADEVLALLARPFAGHADYQEDWAA